MRWERRGTALLRCIAEGETEAVIPSGVTEIGMEAFSGCKALERIVIPDSVEQIGALAFSHCSSLKELILPDSVRAISEGAFRWCTGLSSIVFGRGLRQIGADTLDGCAAGIDIVWLSRCSYHSLFYRILPPLGRIRSLCAPYQSWSRAGEEEKLLLACGYCFHRELEECYPSDIRAQILDYMDEGLPCFFSMLCEKDCIYELFLQCYERRLFRKPETLCRMFSYVRTRKTSGEEKWVLDRIAEKEGFYSQCGEQTAGEEDKALLRRILSMVPESVMQKRLSEEGVESLPAVRYRGSLRPAPGEALQYVVYAYLQQWPVYDALPVSLRRVEEADEIAALLDPEDLEKAWKELGIEEGECREEMVKKRIRHPGRFLPILRYAGEEKLEWYITLCDLLSDYPIYGPDGYRAVRVIEKAVMLNDHPGAVLFAEKHDLAEVYAALHGRDREELRVELLCWLDGTGAAGRSIGVGTEKEVRQMIREHYAEDLWRDYLSGRKAPAADWIRRNVEHPELLEVSGEYVWEFIRTKEIRQFAVKRDGHGEVFFCDWKGRTIVLPSDALVRLAHPGEMSSGDVKKWQEYLSLMGMNPEKKGFFRQLWMPVERFSPGGWMDWRKRYEGIEVPVSRLRCFSERGFVSEGLPSEAVWLFFQGKCVMELRPAAQGSCGNAPRLRMGELRNCNLNVRELNQALFAMDELLCHDLIRLGRVSAAPYLSKLDREQTEQLLECSIDIGHRENVAVLLNRKEALAAEKESKAPVRDDLELDW